MKSSLALLLLSLTAFAQPAAPPRVEPPRPLFSDHAPVLSLDALRKIILPNTTIESVTIDPKDGSCRVTAIVTHPPAQDRVKVWIALPMKNWNGRFRGNGGGGFSGGNQGSFAGSVALGFAAGATDTGHEGGSGSFALNANGRLNWQEIRDNAYLGIHEMTVLGKALTTAFYGKAPRYAYFVGSSTGGRQGLMEAQRFPEDYDGILSGCPAVNWHLMVPASNWPQVVMREANNFVAKEKLDAVTAAVIAACDGDDGIVDGVIADPRRCAWDPQAFVGTKVGAEIFTVADAEVVRQIWAGPRGQDGRFLWYGFSRGANLAVVGGTEGAPLRGKPFGPAHEWLKYFIVQDAKWEGATLSRAEFELLFNQSAELYGPVFGADNPDLTHFRDRGGKLIITHGFADQLIPIEGTVTYYESVQRQTGGAMKAAEFARLFLVPGVDHGFRGAGPSPTSATLLAAIVRWVEEGKAPDQLLAELRDKAGAVVRTRPLFPFPQVAKYSGRGSTDDAANFVSSSVGR
ncbi:MAG: tannase/feruloyl esterase family alpha/beta hydrolase [Opitutaceae bacterium]